MRKSQKKKDKKYIKSLELYLVKAEERVKYSLERFDILIISLSSGGLVLSLNLFRDCKDLFVDNVLLKYSWACFSFSLVINLSSQITGYFANKYDINGTKNIIKIIKKKIEVRNQKKLDFIQKIFDILTMFFNCLSFVFLILGIILLVLFVNLKK